MVHFAEDGDIYAHHLAHLFLHGAGGINKGASLDGSGGHCWCGGGWCGHSRSLSPTPVTLPFTSFAPWACACRSRYMPNCCALSQPQRRVCKQPTHIVG